MPAIKVTLAIVFSVFLISCTTLNTNKIQPGSAQYSQVVLVPGTNKDELYERARQFVANNFRKVSAVIQYESKESGRIVGKGVLSAPLDQGITVQYIAWRVPFTIDVKDNRARIQMSNYTQADHGYQVEYQYQLDMVQPEVENLADDFAAAMKTPATAAAADW